VLAPLGSIWPIVGAIVLGVDEEIDVEAIVVSVVICIVAPSLVVTDGLVGRVAVLLLDIWLEPVEVLIVVAALVAPVESVSPDEVV